MKAAVFSTIEGILLPASITPQVLEPRCSALVYCMHRIWGRRPRLGSNFASWVVMDFTSTKSTEVVTPACLVGCRTVANDTPCILNTWADKKQPMSVEESWMDACLKRPKPWPH